MKNKWISASVLAADFAHLAVDVDRMVAAGVDWIHFDVMDHHYVPNLSVGPMVCRALRQAGLAAPVDVHLMVTHPADYVDAFAKAGANLISFHPETVQDVGGLLQQIRNQGMKTGLVFNPDQEVLISEDELSHVDMVMLMSVFPGFGGQSFIDETIGRIVSLRQRLDQGRHDIMLAVDGGVCIDNVRQVSEAGADYFVMGSGLFGADDYAERVQDVRVAMTV